MNPMVLLVNQSNQNSKLKKDCLKSQDEQQQRKTPSISSGTLTHAHTHAHMNTLTGKHMLVHMCIHTNIKIQKKGRDGRKEGGWLIDLVSGPGSWYVVAPSPQNF